MSSKCSYWRSATTCRAVSAHHQQRQCCTHLPCIRHFTSAVTVTQSKDSFNSFLPMAGPPASIAHMWPFPLTPRTTQQLFQVIASSQFSQRNACRRFLHQSAVSTSDISNQLACRWLSCLACLLCLLSNCLLFSRHRPCTRTAVKHSAATALKR